MAGRRSGADVGDVQQVRGQIAELRAIVERQQRQIELHQQQVQQ